MYAIRKSDLKIFTPKSQAICRIMDGSTNAYLRKDREVEDFLKTIEPNYNTALDRLITGKIDKECIYTIAGFVAYVISCSPAAMRIQSDPLKSIVKTSATIMEKRGLLPPPPTALGYTTLTEAMHDRFVNITIDPKYPQAMGIASIRELTTSFGNFKWEILHNNSKNSPFFTSDFPVAIETTDDPRILNRIVPLSPELALRIRPDLMFDTRRSDFSFSKFDYCIRNIGHQEITKLNRLIVRCAEDLVFYRDDHPWVRPFIIKNRHYRIEAHTQRLTTPTGGTLLVSMQKVSRLV